MFQIRIEFTFDSGHRLLDYNGKCAYPHGHTYRAEVFIESQSLNDLGLVYDFTDLKDKIKTWVDENWDHAFLVNSQDSELISAKSGSVRSGRSGDPPGKPADRGRADEIHRKLTFGL